MGHSSENELLLPLAKYCRTTQTVNLYRNIGTPLRIVLHRILLVYITVLSVISTYTFRLVVYTESKHFCRLQLKNTSVVLSKVLRLLQRSVSEQTNCFYEAVDTVGMRKGWIWSRCEATSDVRSRWRIRCGVCIPVVGFSNKNVKNTCIPQRVSLAK